MNTIRKALALFVAGLVLTLGAWPIIERDGSARAQYPVDQSHDGAAVAQFLVDQSHDGAAVAQFPVDLEHGSAAA